VLRPPLGLLAGNQDQLSIVHFAPAAYITFVQFNEENGTIVVRVPIHRRNFFLSLIDLDE
jgi:hypothetical protein